MTNPALTALAASGLDANVVHYEPAGNAPEAAARRGVPLEALIKTIVVRRGEGDYVLVLVPGDRSIDWPKLRAHLGVSRLSLPDAADALAATGYERGTITPFGAWGGWPVVVDATIPENVNARAPIQRPRSWKYSTTAHRSARYARSRMRAAGTGAAPLIYCSSSLP